MLVILNVSFVSSVMTELSFSFKLILKKVKLFFSYYFFGIVVWVVIWQYYSPSIIEG